MSLADVMPDVRAKLSDDEILRRDKEQLERILINLKTSDRYFHRSADEGGLLRSNVRAELVRRAFHIRDGRGGERPCGTRGACLGCGRCADVVVSREDN